MDPKIEKLLQAAQKDFERLKAGGWTPDDFSDALCDLLTEKPRRIAITFPDHVQTWTVTPHGGELAGTARRLPEPREPRGHALPAPPVASHANLQPRADLGTIAPGN